MLNYLKELWRSKIEINIRIVYPVKGVDYITKPTVINVSSPAIKKIRQSNLRFVEELKVDELGKELRIWSTERFTGKRWEFISTTLSTNKQDAMALHLKIAENGETKERREKTVIWEGLDIEETKMWSAINATEK
jgi:hypothetical protein